MGMAAWPAPAASAVPTAAPHPCNECRRRRRSTCPRYGGAAAARPGEGWVGTGGLGCAMAMACVGTHGSSGETQAGTSPSQQCTERGCPGLGTSTVGAASTFSPSLSLILLLKRMVRTSIPRCACCCHGNECILKTNTWRWHTAEKLAPLCPSRLLAVATSCIPTGGCSLEPTWAWELLAGVATLPLLGQHLCTF